MRGDVALTKAVGGSGCRYGSRVELRAPCPFGRGLGEGPARNTPSHRPAPSPLGRGLGRGLSDKQPLRTGLTS